MTQYFAIIHENAHKNLTVSICAAPTPTTETEILALQLQEVEDEFDPERESLTVIELTTASLAAAAFQEQLLQAEYEQLRANMPSRTDWGIIVEELVGRIEQESNPFQAAQLWTKIAAHALTAAENTKPLAVKCCVCLKSTDTLIEATDFHGHVFALSCAACHTSIQAMLTYCILLNGGYIDEKGIVQSSPNRSCEVQGLLHLIEIVKQQIPLLTDTPHILAIHKKATTAAHSLLPFLPSDIHFYRDYETPQNKEMHGVSTIFALLSKHWDGEICETIAPLENGTYVGGWQISKDDLLNNCERLTRLDPIPLALWHACAHR